MEEIIEKLYNLQVGENPYPVGVAPKEDNQREWDLYGELYDGLSKEKMSILREYLCLFEERMNKEKQYYYEKGFKTAVKLIIESIKL